MSLDQFVNDVACRITVALRRSLPLCLFETPLEDLVATYDDHLRLIGKSVADFLLVSAIVERPNCRVG